jgi:hypothetical protein
MARPALRSQIMHRTVLTRTELLHVIVHLRVVVYHLRIVYHDLLQLLNTLHIFIEDCFTFRDECVDIELFLLIERVVESFFLHQGPRIIHDLVNYLNARTYTLLQTDKTVLRVLPV